MELVYSLNVVVGKGFGSNSEKALARIRKRLWLRMYVGCMWDVCGMYAGCMRDVCGMYVVCMWYVCGMYVVCM